MLTDTTQQHNGYNNKTDSITNYQETKALPIKKLEKLAFKNLNSNTLSEIIFR